MQSKVKLSRRQLKEDKFTTFMLNSREKFQENWQFYVIGFVSVILIIAAVTYYINDQRNKQQEAELKFARAIMDYRNGNRQIAVLGLTQITEDYNNDISRQALYMLGNVNMDNKNYPEAIRFFEKYARENKQDKLYSAAALAGAAAAYENQGQLQEAAQKYEEAIQAYPDGPSVGNYHFGAMRNLLMTGDVAKAKEHLDVIKDKFKGTTLSSRAIRLFYEKAPLDQITG